MELQQQLNFLLTQENEQNSSDEDENFLVTCKYEGSQAHLASISRIEQLIKDATGSESTT